MAIVFITPPNKANQTQKPKNSGFFPNTEDREVEKDVFKDFKIHFQ